MHADVHLAHQTLRIVGGTVPALWEGPPSRPPPRCSLWWVRGLSFCRTMRVQAGWAQKRQACSLLHGAKDGRNFLVWGGEKRYLNAPMKLQATSITSVIWGKKADL